MRPWNQIDDDNAGQDDDVGGVGCGGSPLIDDDDDVGQDDDAGGG